MKLSKVFVVLIAIFMVLSFSCKQKTDNLYASGLIIDEEAYQKVPKKAQQVSRAYTNLPSAVILTSYTPEIADQGNYGTCVAWASTYAGMTTCESLYQRRTNKWDTTKKAFSPYYLYRSCNPDQITSKQVTGMQMETALEFLKNKGVPHRISWEQDMEYKDFDFYLYENSPLFKIDDYARLTESPLRSYLLCGDYSDEELEKICLLYKNAIKKSLSENKPVLISHMTTDSFFQLKGKTTWNVKEKDYQQLLNYEHGYHAMLIVGYDDSRNAFLIQNSWGSKWGNNGLIWVDYDDEVWFLRGAYEMSTAVSRVHRHSTLDYEPEPAPVPTPTPAPEPVKPVLHKVFEASVDMPIVKEDTDMAFTLKGNCYETSQNYDSFTRFQVYMTNTTPCYVYAFASDSTTKKANMLFPLDNTSALLDYSENTVVYPSEDTAIQLDAVSGTDYFVMVYSLKELDSNAIITAFESKLKTETDIYKAAKEAIGSGTLVDASNITYSSNKVSFTANVENVTDDLVMPVVMKIHHE